MTVAFLLLALLVQAVALVNAGHRATAIVSAAAVDASLPGADTNDIRRRARDHVAALVPGARHIDAAVLSDDEEVTVRVRFRWVPPGPAWVPIWIGAASTATRAVPP